MLCYKVVQVEEEWRKDYGYWGNPKPPVFNNPDRYFSAAAQGSFRMEYSTDFRTSVLDPSLTGLLMVFSTNDYAKRFVDHSNNKMRLRIFEANALLLQEPDRDINMEVSEQSLYWFYNRLHGFSTPVGKPAPQHITTQKVPVGTLFANHVTLKERLY